jgi:Tfp pilus assembly protein PilN
VKINLLPPEILERQRARRRTFAVVAFGLVLLLVMGGFYVLQLLRLSDLEDRLAAQRTTNAQLQAQIAELQEVAALQQQLSDSRALLADLLSNQVYWSSILRDVSLVIPGEAWLAGLTGAVAGAEAGETTELTVAPGLVGTISFTGFAFDHRDVALWLSRLEDVRGFINPWLASSSKTLVGTSEVVTFESSVDLSEQVLARRGGSS